MPIGFRNARKGSKPTPTMDLPELFDIADGGEWPAVCKIAPDSPASPPSSANGAAPSDTLVVHGLTNCRVLNLRPPTARTGSNGHEHIGSRRSCSISLQDESVLFERIGDLSNNTRKGSHVATSASPTSTSSLVSGDTGGYQYDSRIFSSLRLLIKSQCSAEGRQPVSDRTALRVRAENLSASPSSDKRPAVPKFEDFIVFPNSVFLSQDSNNGVQSNAKENSWVVVPTGSEVVRVWKLIYNSGHGLLQAEDVALNTENRRWKACINADYLTAGQLAISLFTNNQAESSIDGDGSSSGSDSVSPVGSASPKNIVRAVPVRRKSLPLCFSALQLTSQHATHELPLLPLDATSVSLRPFLLATLHGECVLISGNVHCAVQLLGNSVDSSSSSQSLAYTWQQSALPLARLLLSMPLDVIRSAIDNGGDLPLIVCEQALGLQLSTRPARTSSPHSVSASSVTSLSQSLSSVDLMGTVFTPTPPGTPKTSRNMQAASATTSDSGHPASDHTQHGRPGRGNSLPGNILAASVVKQIDPYSWVKRSDSFEKGASVTDPQPHPETSLQTSLLQSVPEVAGDQPPPLPSRKVSPGRQTSGLTSPSHQPSGTGSRPPLPSIPGPQQHAVPPPLPTKTGGGLHRQRRAGSCPQYTPTPTVGPPVAMRSHVSEPCQSTLPETGTYVEPNILLLEEGFKHTDSRTAHLQNHNSTGATQSTTYLQLM